MISIIMPVFNKADTILASTQTILDQTYKDWELIIIDDASTDRTPDILATAKDKRIRVVTHKKNRGVAKSYEEGFKLAKGKFSILQDPDDYSLPDRLQKCLDTIQGNDVLYHGLYIASIYPGTPMISYSYRAAEEWNSERIKREQYIPGVIFGRTSILRKINIPKVAEGAWDWMMHIQLHALGAKYQNLDEGLYIYFRYADNSLSAQNEWSGKRNASIEYIKKL